jgi:hypothetical protein
MQRPAGRQRLLRLRAEDAEDIAILSAQLQDAIVPVADVAYLADAREFVMVVNRFMWNLAPDPAGPGPGGGTGAAGRTGNGRVAAAGNGRDPHPDGPLYFRTNCGVCIRNVDNLQADGIDLTDRGQMLNLLAMELIGDAVTLHFSGGGELRVVVNGVDCRMQDIDEPWPTRHRPRHDVREDHRNEGGNGAAHNGGDPPA